MFGLRLKTWMEAHLKPRHKSTAHQTQKQQRGAPKESSSVSITTINSSVVSSTGVVSINSTNPSYSSTNSNTTPSLIFQHHSNESNQSSDLSSILATPSSSQSSSVIETQQHQQRGEEEEEEHSLHHLNQQQRHLSQPRPSQQGQGASTSSGSSTSTNILLGSFSNNLSLSSPDTGYSTDGYSPKSVYPALSFESSGKSTPKSSYTISSLVSSERLHLNNSSSSGASSKSTGGAPSKNSSISNGLELEEEEDPCCNIQGLQDETSNPSSTANLNLPEGEQECQHHRRLLDHENNPNGHHNDGLKSTLDELKDDRIFNEPIGLGGSSPYPSPNNPMNKQLTNSVNVNLINSKVTCTSTSGTHPPPLPSIETTVNSRMESEYMLTTTSNSNAIIIPRFPLGEKHDYFHHRRTESMDEQRARHEGIENSSSKLIGGCLGGRNIRTSLLLSNQIPPECNPGLKNAFSLCSPRRQRTRIKTNPWVSLTQHNDNNFHVRYLHNLKTETSASALLAAKQISCPTTTIPTTTIVTSSPSQSQRQIHYGGDYGGGGGLKMEEINNKMEGEVVPEEEDGGTDNVVGLNSASSLLYRISTSTSDSGKGSLEPGTNRNSTESSSCLLSDSTSNSGNSARNSIISPENTISSGSSLIIPTNINTVPVQTRSLLESGQQQCVTSNGGSKTAISKTCSLSTSSSSSSSSKLKSKFKESSTTSTSSPVAPSICITNSSKPSGKRLNSVSVSKRSSNKLSGVVPSVTTTSQTEYTTRCPNLDNYHSMVDKETDILSDWINTDEDVDEEEEEEEEEEDDEDAFGEDDEEECITPTPSSPDVTFNNSSSCSSKLEFIDDRVRHPKTNINLHANNSTPSFLMGVPSYQHQQHNMNLPTNTACYQSVPISPNTKIVTKLNSSPMMRPIQIPDAYAYDNVHHLNQLSLQDPPSNHVHGGYIPSTTTTTNPATTFITSPLTPAMTAARCFNNGGLTQSKLKSDHHNSNTSQTIARGALGFFRKMFKKSNSSHGGGGGKFLRSSRQSHGSNNKDNGVDRDSTTIIPVGLLSPESVVVTNYPLSNTKPLSPAINGNFLTPTPNSFRRRSTGLNSEFVNDSSKTCTSKHKVIKTDIIRLPPSQLAASSSSSIQSQSSAIHSRQHPSQSMLTSNVNGAPLQSYTSSPKVSGFSSHQQQQSNLSNTNTNSTTGSSSVHSMSITSQCSTNSLAEQQHHQIIRSPAPRDLHHENSSSSTNYSMNEVHNSRQSPFMSTTPTNHHQHHNNNRTPRPHHHPNNNNSFINNNHSNVSPHQNGRFQNTCTTPVVQQLGGGNSRDYHHEVLISASCSPNLNSKCPYDSPRLQNTGGSRINSPSFNNYSPIHRLVVTGGNHHLLNRALPTSTSSFHPPPPPPNNNHHHSPLLLHHPLTPNSHGHNLNRPVTTTSSPLINHRHSVVSSSSTQQHPFVTCSPSPVLRNPRYQYITSSNQNSPLLNIPKRLNVPLNPKGIPSPLPGLSKHNIPLFQSPSSIPPPTNNTGTFLNHGSGGSGSGHNNNYYCQNPLHTSESSPKSNSHHQISQSQQQRVPHYSTQQTTDNNNHNHIASTSTNMPNGIFPHPELFRQSHSHYYSSPVSGSREGIVTNSSFYPPLHGGGGELNGVGQGAERIYETVDDSEEDDFRSDDGDGQGGDFEFQGPRQSEGPTDYRMGRESDRYFRRSIDSDTSIGDRSSRSHNLQPTSVASVSSSGSNSSRCKSTSKSKSRRSKREPIFSSSSQQQQPKHLQQLPQPPLPPRSFPMSLGTYLSETETRLLEADREDTRKYKRLINEAEALLKEISIEKSQPSPQPSAWLSRYARQDLHFRHDDCPQSDPLRRKAYDCWALRRLQHQLAGLASPPVLHRKSPMSPSGNQNLFVFRDHHEFTGFRRNPSLNGNNNPIL